MPPSNAKLNWARAIPKPGGGAAVAAAPAAGAPKTGDTDDVPDWKKAQQLQKKIQDGQNQIGAKMDRVTAAIDSYFEALLQGLTQFAETMQDTRLDDLENKGGGTGLTDVLFKAFEVLLAVGLPELEAVKMLGEVGAKAFVSVITSVAELVKDVQVQPTGKSTYHDFVFEIRKNLMRTR